MVNTIGMTAKPITKPTTRELRESYVAPVVCRHHSRKSAMGRPVAVSFTVKKKDSIAGPACQAAQAHRARNGSNQRNSMPGLTCRRTGWGSTDQRKPAEIAAGARMPIAQKSETSRGSTSGANQRPARKPRTTDGSEAMTSMTGLTTWRYSGRRNCET